MFVERKELLIDGEFVPSRGGGVTELVEAATEQPLRLAVDASAADIDHVAAAARAAFPAWAGRAPAERAEILGLLAEAIRSRGEAPAELVSRENGMPISLSRTVNARTPTALFDYYAGLVRDRDTADVREGRGRRTIVRPEPIGVVAAITPWNFPQALATMKIAPALAAGCTVVFKASPETSLDAFVLADAAQEAGLPPGVLNVVPGGAQVGAHLVSHPEVDKVAFTGSTAAGRAIGEVCGRLIRPVSLELGGKSATVVLDDVDLETFTANIFRSSFVNNGQTCFLSSRILAPAARYEEIVDAVTSVAESLTLGDPLDPSTTIGPLVSGAHRRRVLDSVEQGRAGSARLSTGGGVPADRPAGFFVQPTVFADVDNGEVIAQEEIFGPVLSVIGYDTEEQAPGSPTTAPTAWAAPCGRPTRTGRSASPSESGRGRSGSTTTRSTSVPLRRRQGERSGA